MHSEDKNALPQAARRFLHLTDGEIRLVHAAIIEKRKRLATLTMSGSIDHVAGSAARPTDDLLPGIFLC
jgi:hypothetical protein